MAEPYPARIRAARAFADLTAPDLAAALGVSVRTIGRLESGESPSSIEQRRLIAEACNVPDWFLEYGFDGATLEDTEPSVRDRVERLELERQTYRSAMQELRDARARVDEIAARLERTEEQVSLVMRLAALWPTLPPPGVQPLGPQESPRSEPSPRRSERRPGQGDRSDSDR